MLLGRLEKDGSRKVGSCFICCCFIHLILLLFLCFMSIQHHPCADTCTCPLLCFSLSSPPLQPGVIDKFAGDTRAIISKVALEAENKGLFEEAVRLYELAKVSGAFSRLTAELLSSLPPPLGLEPR